MADRKAAIYILMARDCASPVKKRVKVTSAKVGPERLSTLISFESRPVVEYKCDFHKSYGIGIVFPRESQVEPASRACRIRKTLDSAEDATSSTSPLSVS